MRKNLPDLSALPKEVEIVDVSARDGLQSLPFPLPTHKRVLWIRALLEAGLREVEGGAFVSEERVPTMAGTEEVFAALSDLEKERVWALAPNEKGFSRAAKAGAKKIICLASATEKHSRENLG
ncbi:hydroxymethylglutaryl-CoA lyase, partial [bacterium]